jgi:hypothetical protein
MDRGESESRNNLRDGGSFVIQKVMHFEPTIGELAAEFS